MQSSDASDTKTATLLQRMRDWDPRALGEIHDRYYASLYRYALCRVGDDAAAQDIAAEVFLRLLDALHDGRAPRTSLGGWLFGVAAHLVGDYFRRIPRESVPLSETFISSTSPAVEVEERLQYRQLRAAMSRLTPEQHAVLTLRFGNGFSLEQTAQALGKSVNAIKALQFRATRVLRRALVEMENE